MEKALPQTRKINDISYLLDFKWVYTNDGGISKKNLLKYQKGVNCHSIGTKSPTNMGYITRSKWWYSLCCQFSMMRKLNQSCSERLPVFVHPSFYRALKLKFSWAIGLLTTPSILRWTKAQWDRPSESLSRICSIYIPTPNRTDHVSLDD